MATFLFTDFSDFKAYAGGTVNQSVYLDSLKPALEEAANTHILPWLSQAQWDVLEAAVEAESTTSAQDALLDKLKRPFAILAMYEHTATAGIQVSEAGLQRAESENMKSAYKYQEAQYREWMLHTGYNRLENMIQFLNSNSADYPTWAASDEAARSRALFVNYAAELRLLYSKNLSRYTFEVLRPVIEDMEEFAILPVLGDEFYSELKAAIAAGSTTAEQDTVIQLIRRAVAHLAVNEAVKQNVVRLEGDMLVKAETLEPQGYTRKGAPSGADIDLKTHYEYTAGNRHISVLVRFLENNLDDYPTYKAYYDALAEAAAAEAAEEADSERTCAHGPGCGCSISTTRKSIVRL